jgi:hypothetical protein
MTCVRKLRADLVLTDQGERWPLHRSPPILARGGLGFPIAFASRSAISSRNAQLEAFDPPSHVSRRADQHLIVPCAALHASTSGEHHAVIRISDTTANRHLHPVTDYAHVTQHRVNLSNRLER